MYKNETRVKIADIQLENYCFITKQAITKVGISLVSLVTKTAAKY